MELTILMIIDAVIAIGLIASVLLQEGKSAGMGGLSGETDTVFSSKARGLDALMAKVTVVFAILFGILTVIIAKMTA
ncbi:preprotein translocase subunit SecG [Pectinatus brassicae]|uniref:Protein-export membrane protein SecG n=2 Tax=Pectinatus brassicae TaxID=862415 RepID=A0A840UFJ5_9FIRM|nr:preprotein translocase subunit SecG [Pectinatus brassicae]